MRILSTIPRLANSVLLARLPTLVSQGAVMAFQHAGTLLLVWREPFGQPDGQALIASTAGNHAELEEQRVPTIVYDSMSEQAAMVLARLQRALAVGLPGGPKLGVRSDADGP